MMHLKKCAVLAALVLLALATASASYAQATADATIAPAQKCGDLTKMKVSGMDLAITKAEEVRAGIFPPSRTSPEPAAVSLPGYCGADGVIDERKGVDGVTYGIGFSIALPDNWNGRFLMQGGGGLNGIVQMPLGAVAAGKAPGLARGFAVISTDTGHKSGGGAFDSSFRKDQLASLDFDYIAVGRVAALAKRIIAEYYGQPAKHSYFAGCSTGGREAMLMSQRYPGYFDGIISGDPAMETGYSNIGLSWAMKAFSEIAPKDAEGKPVPSKAFSTSDKKLLAESIMKACDDKDGLKDGMIFNRKACHFDPAVLKCKGAKEDLCLSAAQVNALQIAFSGPKDSAGNQVYVPFPYDSDMILQPPNGFGLSFLPTAGPNILGNVLPPNVSVDQQVADVRANAAQGLSDTATWTNLSTFSGHGGKLIFFHGTSDPWFSVMATLDYYERMSKDNGGINTVENWSRIYLVPGMNHCGGGAATLDQFDMLSALVNWVEKGTAPDFVIATGRSFPGRSRPLCAYPKYARYEGKGDTENASNFACVTEDAER